MAPPKNRGSRSEIAIFLAAGCQTHTACSKRFKLRCASHSARATSFQVFEVPSDTLAQIAQRQAVVKRTLIRAALGARPNT